MTRNDQPTTEQQLQAYQDGLLSEADRQAFEATLRERPELAEWVRVQTEVDDSLRRLFRPPVPPAEIAIDDSPPHHVNGLSRFNARPRLRWIALLVTAAVVAWALVAWQLPFRGGARDEPFFAPRPLIEIYENTIARGFKPYYECRDDERFAFTFELRQGQRLRLTELPEGRQMLGLSYSGGLSRDTTAMLCTVDGQPVIVFVDRREADRPQPVDENQSQISILRRESAGLVFYEVTPHPESRILDYLIPSDN